MGATTESPSMGAELHVSEQRQGLYWTIYTGSGPDSWSDDGTPYGIFDLNGNTWSAQRAKTGGRRDQITPAAMLLWQPPI